MSQPQLPTPDSRKQSVDGQRQPADDQRETNRPSDSVPGIAGVFANLPAKFGRYQVESLLGRGAMGSVYLARDTQLDRLVALKIPRVAGSGSRRLLLRLETEAKAAAKLDHPGLCKVYDAGEVDGQCFIAMQYIDGETLKSQLAVEGKSVEEAVWLIQELAYGLSEAHEQGIIHRDLKPENIMINRRGTPVIMDFGLAKFSTMTGSATVTQAGTILGTPAYMSPEQASGNLQQVDQRSDIYALGIILFEMLTGTWPFEGSAMQILGQKSIVDPVSPASLNPDLPPHLAAICHQMIAREIADRYQTLADLIADLSEVDLTPAPPVDSEEPPAEPDELPVEVPDYQESNQAEEQFGLHEEPAQEAPAEQVLHSAVPSEPRSWQLRAWWQNQPQALRWTALLGTGAILMALGIFLFVPPRPGELQFEIDNPSLTVRFDGQEITINNDRQPIRVTPKDKHAFEIWHDGRPITVESAARELTLKQGEKRRVTLKLVAGEVLLNDKSIWKLPVVLTPVAPAYRWPSGDPTSAIAPFDATQAKAAQDAWAKHLGLPVEYNNDLGMKFVLIPPCDFNMGSTPAEIEAIRRLIDPNERISLEFIKSEAPRHQVILTQPFYLGVHEVSQKQYEDVMGKNPSRFVPPALGKNAAAELKDTTSHPVEMVSWNESAEFCTKLSEMEKLKPFYIRSGEKVTHQAGTGYRLPTEAEWEFACRAGTTTRYWIGDKEDDLLQVGWIGTNSGQRTHPVGELRANPFGLYDMHGNVLEWVQEWWEMNGYAKFQSERAVDPNILFSDGMQRVCRGGSWNDPAPYCCRVSNRKAANPTYRGHDIGFRVALTVDAVKATIAPKAETPLPVGTGWQDWPKEAPPPAIALFSSDEAKKCQADWAKHVDAPTEYTNSLGMKFVFIPPGEFMMGSTPANVTEALKFAGGKKARRELVTSEVPQHKVILTQPIYLGAHEVTQEQYEDVMKQNPSQFALMGAEKAAVAGMDTTTHPVEMTSWNDAVEFCAKLSLRLNHKPFHDRVGETVMPLDGTGYRLPTEAEWEFACRAATTTKYWISDRDEDLERAAWLKTNSDLRTHPVGKLKSNPFGLFDIHGNVCEWVQDGWDRTYYAQFEGRPAPDPRGPPAAGSQRVIRGGDWNSDSSRCRASTRDANDPQFRNHEIGFRVSLLVSAVKAEIAAKAEQEIKPASPPPPAIAPFNPEEAKAHQAAWASHLKLPVEITNNIGMRFILLPPGEFMMGSTPEEIKAVLQDNKTLLEYIRTEGPRHRVKLTRPIYFGVHEVTQEQYEKVMLKAPSHFAATGAGKGLVPGLDTTSYAVESVKWNDAAEFCTKLSTMDGLQLLYARAGTSWAPQEGIGYRLPTEAEWEFACRAGTTTNFWTGDSYQDLAQAGWFAANAGPRTHAVGELKANPFGLHDMHGNVWEWVQDWSGSSYYSQFQEQSAVDPSGPSTGSRRVLRGGVWSGTASQCRASYRHASPPTTRNLGIGFRVVLLADAVKPASGPPKAKGNSAKAGWQGWPKNAPDPAISPFSAAKAKNLQGDWAKYLDIPVRHNSFGMQFVLIPPGEFTMGSSPAEIDAELAVAGNDEFWKGQIRSEGPQHKVILTQPIYLGVHEVTQRQYADVMGRNPSYVAPQVARKVAVVGPDKSSHPVEMVSWNDAAEFCAKLSEQAKLKPFYFRAGESVTQFKGTGYRLPTEAEWEFACRAGALTKYWFGNDEANLARAGWFVNNSARQTHPVGGLMANPFGLEDAYGNVWEWVHDGWDASYYGQFQGQPALDPAGPTAAGSRHMIRGGSWTCAAPVCRSAYRLAGDPTYRDQGIGFRVALVMDEAKVASAKSKSASPSLPGGMIPLIFRLFK